MLNLAIDIFAGDCKSQSLEFSEYRFISDCLMAVRLILQIGEC